MIRRQLCEALHGHWRSRLEADPGGLALDWLGQPLTALELGQRVEAERRTLREPLAGADPETVRIGILAPDGAEALINGLALLFEGLTHAVLPLRAAPSARDDLRRRYALSHLLADPAALPDWPGLRILGRTSEGLVLAELATDGAAPEGESRDAATGPVAILSTTSGTTSGRPGVVRLHWSALVGIQRSLDWSPYDLLRRPLLDPSLQQPSARGWKLRTLLRGETAVVRPPGERFAATSFASGADGCAMTPTALRSRLLHDDLNALPEGFLVITGSDQLPMELRRQLQALRGPRFGLTYATSQTGPLTWLPPEELLAEDDSVGRPLPNVRIRPHGPARLHRLGHDFHEVRIEKRRSTLMPDGRGGLVPVAAEGIGHFDPGDLLALTGSGHVIFGGRANDVFLFQGELVSPYEIEDLLRGDPAVEECVAFGAPSACYGAVPMAAVVLHADAADPPAVAERLRDLCRRELGHRAAKRIVVLEDVPRGPGGKPLRRVLAERHALRL